MAQLSDFISRIFSADRSQGLSGGAEVVVDPDPAAAFYASRLRKHRTDEDLVASPEHLWASSSFAGRKGGLRAHIHAERGDGVASFTDVLVVINQADAQRISAVGSQAWGERAAEAVASRFAAWSQKEKFELLYPSRALAFRFLADGSEEMASQSFGLGPGEYITGLLPNFYVSPGPHSRPVLAVHLNVPGAWEGYREVGKLYNDQSLFTLGRHWLDNFRHPALREPGLYRLQQYPDGSLVHVISPEVQDRYLVRSDSVTGGASVLTISEWSGEPVAYLVLAVVDEAVTPVAVEEVVVRPAAPLTLSAGGAGRANLQRTIVPGAIESRILTLQERGALLQKVHFGNFMEGYDVYIGHNGRIGTQIADPKAVLQVRGARVSLLAHDPGVTLGGRPAPVGKPTPLKGEVVIEVDGNRLQYHDLSDVRMEGWPYLGELRRPGAGAYLEFGGVHRVGRDRRCKVRLPDEPHNENIAWLPTVGGGATIRSRTGDIPKSRFYTDSIMVASEHAELDLTGEPVLRSLARHCYTFVRRGREYLALSPREGAGGRHVVELAPNDEILVGNCLFQASYLPPGQALPAAPPATIQDAPRIQLNAAELASAVDVTPLAAAHTYPPGVPDGVTLPFSGEPTPVIEALPTVPLATAPELGAAGGPLVPAPSVLLGSGPRPEVRSLPPASRLTVDVAPAAGLGEVGIPPRAVDVAGSPRVERRDRKPPPPMLIETFEGFPSTPPTPAPVPVVAPEAQVEAPPAVTPEPPPDDPEESVLSVEEAQWQLELARPARLVQIGWMVSGEVVIGNHRGAQLVVPEVRVFPGQPFMTLDYFRVFVRGRKGRVDLLQEGDARLLVGGKEVASTDQLDRVRLEIVRRDVNLEPDFDVVLTLVEAALPDPRARLLRIDDGERLALALFTRGCPLRSARTLRMGGVDVRITYDGSTLRLADYLPSYRGADGRFRALFFREAGKGFQTFPEDGAPVVLRAGDQIVAGPDVYELRTG